MRAYAVRLLALTGLLLAWLVGLVVAPGVAHASCAGRSPAQIVADADVVLTGRLVGVDDPKPNHAPYDVGWTIEVAAVHKGRAPATAQVVATTYTHEDVVAGGAHVFALDILDGVLRAEGCQDVETLGTPQAAALLAAAGPGARPATGVSLPGSTAPALADTTPWWWASPLGLVAVAVGGLLVLVVGGLVVALLAGLAVGGRRRRAADSAADSAAGGVTDSAAGGASDRASGRRDPAGTAFE